MSSTTHQATPGATRRRSRRANRSSVFSRLGPAMRVDVQSVRDSPEVVVDTPSPAPPRNPPRPGLETPMPSSASTLRTSREPPPENFNPTVIKEDTPSMASTATPAAVLGNRTPAISRSALKPALMTPAQRASLARTTPVAVASRLSATARASDMLGLGRKFDEALTPMSLAKGGVPRSAAPLGSSATGTTVNSTGSSTGSTLGKANAIRATPQSPPTSPSNTTTTGGDTVGFSLFAQKERVFVNGIEYVLLAQIGKGGQSVVHKAMDLVSYNLYAIKIAHRKDEDSWKLVLREIDFLKQFRHSKRVCELVDSQVVTEVEDCEDVILMVLELGETDLKSWLQRNSNLGLLQVRQLFQEMLECLEVLHGAEVVHCDIKPANFLFVRGTLKLIDFGISEQIGDNTMHARKSTIVGTLNYISPESVTGEVEQGSAQQKFKVGTKADVFSMGCILYQMVFSRPPLGHLRNNMIQKFHALTSAEPIQIPTTQSVDLQNMLEMCLEKNCERRASVSDLKAHLFLHPDRKISELQRKYEKLKTRVVKAKGMSSR